MKKRRRDLRIKKEITQDQLADAIGLKRSAIGEMERGKKGASLATLNNLANFFDVSIDYLLGRVNDRNIVLVNDKINGRNIEIGIDKNVYPDGLTREQVINILEKLKAAGVNLNPENNK